jgi:hypothetical protein
MSFCKITSCICQVTLHECSKQFLNKCAANIHVNMIYSAFITASDPLQVLQEQKNQHILRNQMAFQKSLWEQNTVEPC